MPAAPASAPPEKEFPISAAFGKALQGECKDVQDDGPHLTLFFDPGAVNGFAVHKLSVAFQVATAPIPVGYLPGIPGTPEIIGYGKTQAGLCFIAFTYDGLDSDMAALMQSNRFLCHLSASNVVQVESSTGLRVHLADVRFRTENIKPNENAPALI